MTVNDYSIKLVRWIARALAAILFLFWGSFFVEHLEWFSHASMTPPVSVYVTQFLHLVLLAGYLVAMKWEEAGSILIIAGALAFFGFIGLLMKPAGVSFFLISIVPADLLILLWLQRRKSRKAYAASDQPRDDVS